MYQLGWHELEKDHLHHYWRQQSRWLFCTPETQDIKTFSGRYVQILYTTHIYILYIYMYISYIYIWLNMNAACILPVHKHVFMYIRYFGLLLLSWALAHSPHVALRPSDLQIPPEVPSATHAQDILEQLWKEWPGLSHWSPLITPPDDTFWGYLLGLPKMPLSSVVCKGPLRLSRKLPSQSWMIRPWVWPNNSWG